MSGQRFWAHGMTVTFQSVDIEGIESIGLGDEITEEVEITDNDSGGVEEFVAGLRRSGNLTLTCRKIMGATGQVSIRTARSNGTVGEIIVTVPSSAATAGEVGTFTFDALVVGISHEFPQVENTPAMVTYTFKVSGEITEAFS